MDDAAVVPGLMCGDPVLGLEDSDRHAAPLGELHGRREADDAAPHDGEVVGSISHSALLLKGAAKS